jgi:hypothetical protein
MGKNKISLRKKRYRLYLLLFDYANRNILGALDFIEKKDIQPPKTDYEFIYSCRNIINPNNQIIIDILLGGAPIRHDDIFEINSIRENLDAMIEQLGPEAFDEG